MFTEMTVTGSLPFLDFPVEIQELILRKCLEGWKATVETHEKPEEKKSTTRLWSSVIHDALMLSLTCKHFFKIIQNTQKDPRLFSGEIDLIDANAEISYLVGIFTSKTDPYYVIERDSKPRPLYRTQTFIKANPYDKSDPDWRSTRLKYHANVRNWLNQHVRSLGLWADEVNSRIPWQMFPSLQNITIYWPCAFFYVSEPTLPLCQHSHEDLVSSGQCPKNLLSAWDLSTAMTIFENLMTPDVTLTIKYDVPHMHVAKKDLETLEEHEQYGKFHSNDYYNLECTFTVRRGIWTVASAVCHAQSPIELDAEEKAKFAQYSIRGY